MKHSSGTLESGFVILPIKWNTYVLLFLASHDGGCRSTWPMAKRTRKDWGSEGTGLACVAGVPGLG